MKVKDPKWLKRGNLIMFSYRKSFFYCPTPVKNEPGTFKGDECASCLFQDKHTKACSDDGEDYSRMTNVVGIVLSTRGRWDRHHDRRYCKVMVKNRVWWLCLTEMSVEEKQKG